MRKYRQKRVTKTRRDPSKKIAIPFHRVSAEIQITSTRQTSEARVFLTDLAPEGVGIFLPIPLSKGDMVNLVINQPKHLFVKGKVTSCAPYTLNNKVISTENFSYRIGIQFVFDSPEEKANVKKYCDELYDLTG